MTEERLATEQTNKICLFDFECGVLEKIFTNKELFDLLKKSGKSYFFDEIDMFLDVSGDGDMWAVREEDKERAREAWSIELPVEIIAAINKIVKENSQEKPLQSGWGI